MYSSMSENPTSWAITSSETFSLQEISANGNIIIIIMSTAFPLLQKSRHLHSLIDSRIKACTEPFESCRKKLCPRRIALVGSGQIVRLQVVRMERILRVRALRAFFAIPYADNHNGVGNRNVAKREEWMSSQARVQWLKIIFHFDR